MRSDTQCPGCGARNAPEARVCEWCGRAFLLRDQRRGDRPIWTLGAVAGALLAGLVAAAALLGAPALLARFDSSGSPSTTPALPTAEPAPATPTAVLAEPSPEPLEYVRVANTAGQGVILRREPSTSAGRVAARAETAVLQIVGPDQAAEGRVWRQVQDAQGNRGWVPADFLVPAPPPGS